MSKKSLTILYIVLVVLAIGKVTSIMEGLLFLFPPIVSVFYGLPLAALSLLYMIILLVCIIVTRAAHTKWRPRFWSRLTAVVLLLVLWGAPIEPGYDPGLFGYYLRAKIIGDVPAILAWADTYATSTTKPSEENMIGEWEMVSRPGLPNSVSLPDAVRRMGWYVKFRRSDRAAEVSYGSGMAGTWGIKVGHGVGEQAGGTRREVKVNQDAYVWHSEPF